MAKWFIRIVLPFLLYVVHTYMMMFKVVSETLVQQKYSQTYLILANYKTFMWELYGKHKTYVLCIRMKIRICIYNYIYAKLYFNNPIFVSILQHSYEWVIALLIKPWSHAVRTFVRSHCKILHLPCFREIDSTQINTFVGHLSSFYAM